MISDLLIISLALLLGYGIFIASAYFLVKLLLPKMDNAGDFAYSGPNE